MIVDLSTSNWRHVSRSIQKRSQTTSILSTFNEGKCLVCLPSRRGFTNLYSPCCLLRLRNFKLELRQPSHTIEITECESRPRTRSQPGRASRVDGGSPCSASAAGSSLARPKCICDSRMATGDEMTRPQGSCCVWLEDLDAWFTPRWSCFLRAIRRYEACLRRLALGREACRRRRCCQQFTDARNLLLLPSLRRS
jgi:hypothetical protein